MDVIYNFCNGQTALQSGCRPRNVVAWKYYCVCLAVNTCVPGVKGLQREDYYCNLVYTMNSKIWNAN